MSPIPESAYVSESHRCTGRTGRMLMEVLSQAQAGRSVWVVARTTEASLELRDRMRGLANGLGVPVRQGEVASQLSVHGGGSVSFRGMSGFGHSGPLADLFMDHACHKSSL